MHHLPQTSTRAVPAVPCNPSGRCSNPLFVIRSKTRLFEDQLCKSCHTTQQYRSVHRIHTFGSCVRCHMPRVAKIGEAGDAHSHTFRFLFPQATIESRRPGYASPTHATACHHHKETPTEDLVGFLEAAKKSDMPKPFTGTSATLEECGIRNVE